MKIAFIGLGNMGGGMAANLVKAGHDVRAFDLGSDGAHVDARGERLEVVAELFDLGLQVADRFQLLQLQLAIDVRIEGRAQDLELAERRVAVEHADRAVGRRARRGCRRPSRVPARPTSPGPSGPCRFSWWRCRRVRRPGRPGSRR